jgi:nitrogen fixation-related uncharacterized protein
MLTELVEPILQGALEWALDWIDERAGHLVLGILIIIFATIVRTFFWSSSPKQIEDLTSKRIFYQTSYLKGDKHDQQIVLEGEHQKYWIDCKYWRLSQDQAWDLMEKLNSSSEAVIYIWKESSRGATIWGITTPLKLDPSPSIAWSKFNDRVGKWVMGIFYAIGIGFVISGFCEKKSV